MGEFSRIYKADLTDRQLASLWEMVRAAGRDRKVLFGLPPMDGTQFADWLRREDESLWAILFRGVPCGVMLLDSLRGKTADIHFCTLPFGTLRLETHAGRVPGPVGFLMYVIGTALWERNASNGFILDTVYGTIPECHEAALKTCARAGVKFHSKLPSFCWCYDTGDMVDGIMTISTRAEFPQWTAAL